jgi:hypothetical protein
MACPDGNASYIGRNSSMREPLALVSPADAVFSLNNPAIPNNKMMSFKKLFETMMLGRPVVVNRGTSMEEKVRAVNCGSVVENGRRAYVQFYD